MKKLCMVLVTTLALFFGTACAQESSVPVLECPNAVCVESPEVEIEYDLTVVNGTLATTYEILTLQANARLSEVFVLGGETAMQYYGLMDSLDTRNITPDNAPEDISKLMEEAGTLLNDSASDFHICVLFVNMAGVNAADAEDFNGEVANIAYAEGIKNLCFAIDRASVVETKLQNAQKAIELTTSILPDPEA